MGPETHSVRVQSWVPIVTPQLLGDIGLRKEQWLRVLHVINSLSGSGGAENGLVREVGHLADRFDQAVVTLYRGGHLARKLEDVGVEVHSLGLDPSQSGWNWILGIPRLRRMLEAHKPHVVHSSLASANLISQLAARGRGIPVLSTFTLSGDVSLMRNYQPGAGSWKASAFRTVSGFAARSDHVWFRAITRDAAATNAKALGVDVARVSVIPRGVPLGDSPGGVHDSLKRSLGLPQDRPILLNVGRQTAQKGHGHLIEAFITILETRPAHLVILGRKGDTTAELNRAIGGGSLHTEVTVIPYTEHVRDYYRAAEVFVFTSLMEGLGTAVLEAMAEGLPVVAFDIPPVAEVTDSGHVAVLVREGDSQELAEAVTKLLDDPAFGKELAHNARAWVHDHFSISTIAVRLGNELERIADLSA